MKLTRFSLFLLGFTLIGLAVSLLSNVYQSEAAFGTSPPWVRNDHLLPGTTYETVINLSRNDPDSAMKVKARIDGEEIRRWITIEDEDDLIMEKGQKILPMKVIVKVPRRAALKDYKGGIFVTLEAVQEEGDQKGGTVAIRLGAHIVVELTVVGDEIIDYRIKSITLDPLTEGDYFYMNVDVENMGNVELKELNGQVDIYNKDESEILHSLTFGALGDAVGPDTLFKTQIVFPDIKLEAGEYWVKFKVFKDDDVLYENRLYQKVNEAEVPVITPEDVEGAKRPSIPTASQEDEQTVLEPDETDELKTAAPVVIQQEGDKWFVVFGIAGLAFGILCLAAIVIVLIVLMRRQQQATLQQYLSQQQRMQSPLHSSAPPEPPQSSN